MAKKKTPTITPDAEYKTVDLYLRLPAEIHAAAEQRSAGGMSVQSLIILTLAEAWKVAPPPLRKRGGQPKEKTTETNQS